MRRIARIGVVILTLSGVTGILAPMPADASTTCVAGEANVAKAGKGLVQAGFCVIATAGTIHGYCGLSDAHSSGTLSIDVLGSQPPHFQNYSIHMSWIDIASMLILSGHWHKHGTTHSGALKGVVTKQPDPTAGSCFNELQKNFLIEGRIAFLSATSPTTTSLPPKPSYKSPPTCSPPC
jgi:hypothetical protein